MTDEPREPGAVEQAVEADIKTVGTLRSGQWYLAASARKLARGIDARGDDESPSSLAKAVDTLRAVMNQLMAKETSDPSDIENLGALLSTPSAGGSSVPPALRYPPQPGTTNARTSRRRRSAGARPE